ncbi:Uncharacterised protein [Cedecea neteri]|uniref:Uncharacterized protein n=1 Tax=Cedecea neteri TaxID=158822 RepID=A0A2X3ILA3_9ENTR|nr:Uncharacterised protein [Cedecea neteri]
MIIYSTLAFPENICLNQRNSFISLVECPSNEINNKNWQGIKMRIISGILVMTLLTGCASSSPSSDLMYKYCRDGGTSISECKARADAYNSSSGTQAGSDTDWGDIGGKVLGVAAVAAVVVAAALAGSNNTSPPPATYKGNCEFSSNTAADGSSCGGQIG